MKLRILWMLMLGLAIAPAALADGSASTGERKQSQIDKRAIDCVWDAIGSLGISNASGSNSGQLNSGQSANSGR